MRSPSLRRAFSGLLVVLSVAGCSPAVRRDASVEDGPITVDSLDVPSDAPALDEAQAEASAPDVSVPDASAPDASAPDVSAPDALDAATPPDAPAPDAPVLDGPSADTLSPFASTCASPVRSLVNGDEVVSRATGPSRESSHSCAPSAPGPEDYFTLYNGGPSRWFLTTDDPRTEGRLALVVRDICTDPSTIDTCARENGARSGTASLTFTEFGRQGFAVVVDRVDSAEPFTYALRARQVGLARNARCYGPQSRLIAADGAAVTGENLETADDDDSACEQVSDTPQLFYRVLVPAMTQVAVTAQPTAPMPVTWRARVRVGTQCYENCTDNNVALAPGAAVRALAVNTSAAAREYWVSVSATEPNVFGTYGLTTASSALVTGDSCAAPEALALDATLRDRHTSDETSAGFGCGITDAGGQYFYSLSVPAGRRVRATVTPTGAPEWTAVLRRFEDCPEVTCAASAVSSAPGAPASLLFENPGDAPRVMRFAVSARGRGAHAYDLAVETLPGVIPYTETRVGARCDALTGPETLLLGAPETVRVLPFTFEYFSQPQTHYALSSAGYLQLFSAASAMPASTGTTLALPDPAAPRSMLAPYWADLIPRVPGGELRAGEVTDAQGRRFVTHWASHQLRGMSGTLVSFQVKLYEASRAIEFHWCALTQGTADTSPVRGRYSTTGLQDPSGIEGITSARNRAATLDTTVAFRYEPRR